MLTVMKLVALAITLSYYASAAPGSNILSYDPELAGIPESYEWSPSGSTSNDIDRIHQACCESYKQEYHMPMQDYVFKPSTAVKRRPENQRSYQSAHESYGQTVDEGDYPPHVPGWVSHFGKGKWEQMYAKTFHALVGFGYHGELARELLTNYGCVRMGAILLENDWYYDKQVVQAMLERMQKAKERN